MDQIYPLAGTTTTSCASQDFDFLNYWVDQTVEKEIKRGKKLRELKTRPTVRKEKYDVINIEHTNVYSEKKCRSRSPRKSRKKRRRNSPTRKISPIRKFTKRDSKSSRQRCPMRIAELSVPSKRQCIDTWRTKYHVLPGIMIDRLRHHVMDLSPVVKIPDAIECFKIHKNAEKRKKKEIKENKLKKFSSWTTNELTKIEKCECKGTNIKKKSSKVQECQYLCAIFGHKIAKELNKPVKVTLNTELQKISNIISIEIEKLINKGTKRIDNQNIKNKSVHAEVAGKISIWIANILDETTYNILADQLKDLEEEIGPVLDLIDDLVDNVVDICEPEPEVIKVSSSSETYNVESSTEYEGKEEESTSDNISVDIDFPPDAEPIIKESTSDNISVDIDFPPDAEPITENLDDFIKHELDKIINSFDGDIPTDIEDETIQDNTEFETVADNELNEFVDANDAFEVNINEAQAGSDAWQDSSESKEGTLIKKELMIIEEKDDNPDYETINDILFEDDSNKKVKFSDVNMVTSDGTTEEDAQIFYPDYHQVVAASNDNLPSDVDEPWPEYMTLPILRPSESVSKSITSLGKIMEEEERMSVLLDDNTNTKANDKIPDAKQINETNEGITDANDNIKPLEDNTEELNDTTIDTATKDKQDKIIETANITSDGIDWQGANEIINSNLTDSLQLNEILYDANEIIEQLNDNLGELNDIAIDTAAQANISETTNITADTANITSGGKYSPQGANEIINSYLTDSLQQDTKDLSKNEIETDRNMDTRSQEMGEDGAEQVDIFIDKIETTYSKKGQEIERDIETKTDFIGKDSQIIQDWDNLAADDVIYLPSTDSTFYHDVPTETVAYEHKLDEILEEQATQVANVFDTKLEDEATQVKDLTILEDEATQITPNDTYKKVDVETADKDINTSFSLVPRADKSTSIASQSLGNIAKRLKDVKADNMFSSLRIKPKVDYKVNKQSAPSWVTQNYGEPTDSLYSTLPKQQKGANDKNIRLWCKDLENGFDNLELWNGWIENTLENVKITKIKKAKICMDKSREEFVRDWLNLKKNVDADVMTWTKLSKSTQVQLKGFRKIYQNFETPPTPGPQQPHKFCNCPK